MASALQTCKALPLQILAPGTQTLSKQLPDLHTWSVLVQSCATLVERPRASQASTWLPLQLLVFGVQIMGLHTPPLHDSVLAQGLSVKLKASALHTCSVALPRQTITPGLHSLLTQPPLLHTWLVAAHSCAWLLVKPLASQNKTLVPLHDLAFGWQTMVLHAPASQLSLAAHALSV